MAILNFPDIKPDSEEWTLEYNSQEFRSDLNGRGQTREMEGARWRVSMGFQNRQGRDARALTAFLTRLEGLAGRFYASPSDSALYGTATQSGTLDEAVLSGATSVRASGFAPSEDLVLAAGDYIEINAELKEVTEDFYGDELEFAPPMRTSLSAGAAVNINNPKCVMMLDSDDMPGWSIAAPIIYSLTIEAREPLAT